jgi:putative FmdB family regulatory protein
MPTYEYKCDACGFAFEKFHSITAEPIKKCPKCAKNKVQRLIGTGAGLIFKGSGFYITDYRSEGYKEKAKAESGAGGGESKGESKGGDPSPGTGGDAKPTTEAKPVAAKAEAPAPKAEPKPEPKAASKSAKKK